MPLESHNQSPASSAHSEQKSTRHYRLTTEEWLQAVHELKPRERDVLYYLRTLDPFGDRALNLGVREIARTLSTPEQEVSPGTISKALKRLDQLGYIDMELVSVNIRIKSKVFPVGNTVSSERQVFPVAIDRFPRETSVSCSDRSFPTGNDRKPEPAPDMDSGSPHTFKTNQTLSDSSDQFERDFEIDEKELLKFVADRAKQDKLVRQPRAYAKKCLNEDREFWIEKFVEWKEEHDRIKLSAAPPSTDFLPQESLDELRDRLLGMWQLPRFRKKISAAIAANPALNLEIVGDELREVVP